MGLAFGPQHLAHGGGVGGSSCAADVWLGPALRPPCRGALQDLGLGAQQGPEAGEKFWKRPSQVNPLSSGGRWSSRAKVGVQRVLV